jgi:hypothetical protein
MLVALGANAEHGLRRTNDDQRKAVRVLLDDPEWCQWADREIARRCGVDGRTITAARASLKPDAEFRISERAGRKYLKDGAVFERSATQSGRGIPQQHPTGHEEAPQGRRGGRAQVSAV